MKRICRYTVILQLTYAYSMYQSRGVTDHVHVFNSIVVFVAIGETTSRVWAGPFSHRGFLTLTRSYT